MARVMIAAGLALLLAGCGRASQPVPANDSSVSREPSSDAKLSNPLAASGGSNDCSKNPDFAPIYAGGKITVCSSTHFDDTGKDAGSFHYTTDATPEAVLAFAKESAAKSGLTVRIENESMVSADAGDKRRFMTMARMQGPQTMVTVNWSQVP